MNATTYESAKHSLKLEICNYFTSQGVSLEVLKKIAASIKADAESGHYHTLAKVAPRHRELVECWIDRLCEIESERAEALYQESINSLEYQQQQGRDEIMAHDMGWNHAC